MKKLDIIQISFQAGINVDFIVTDIYNWFEVKDHMTLSFLDKSSNIVTLNTIRYTKNQLNPN